MTDILNVVTPTFFAILIGYLIGRFFKISMAPVVNITLYVGIPALLFVSLLNQKIILLDAVKIWASAIIVMYGCILVAWIVFKIIRQKHSGLYVSIGLMNTVNIPFPVISLAYGAPGMIAATLFYIPNSLSTYTYGIYMMAGKRWKDNVKEIFIQPLIYASSAGLLCNFLNAPVPGMLYNSLEFVSRIAIPLVLIVLGYNLSKIRLNSVPTTILASFLRIAVGLGLGFLMVNVFDITGIARNVVILDSAMPAAALSSIFAAKYNNEPELVSSVVFLTTLASLAVIPFLLHILG
ncbi:AEC family transporter [Chloroflexota bacterium]